MIGKWLVATEVPAHLRLGTYEARVKEIVTKNRILVHISYFKEKMLGLMEGDSGHTAPQRGDAGIRQYIYL